jgi:superfamily II DNA or RNA helicase
MFELRPYQQKRLALEDYWSRRRDPLVVMATATGKGVVIAHLIRDCFATLSALLLVVTVLG